MSLTAKISADITNFEKNLDKAMRQTDSFTQQLTQKLDKVGDSFINVGKKVSVLSAVVLAAGVASYKMAADFEDAMGASDQIFNDSSDEITDWAKNLKSQYGIAKTEALTMANTMGAMLKNIGQLTESEASKQAAMLVELSGDLAAMFGGSSQDAARALTGALKGNNTMLDNYGMGVNDATVKLKAFELGLMGAKGEMSLQVKQAATLALIMEQSGDAMGQAAREAEGGSGSMRRFTTEIKNLSTSLGEILLPIITPIISKVALFAKSLNELDPTIKKVIVTVGLIAAAAGPALLALGGLLKLAPLIGTAFTAMTGPVGIAIAAIVAGAILIIKNWDEIFAYFTTGDGAETFKAIKRDALKLKDDLEFIFTQISGTLQNIWSKLGNDLEDKTTSFLGTINQGFLNTLNLWRNLWLDLKKVSGASEGLGLTEGLVAEFEAMGTMFSNFGKGLVAGVVEPIDKVADAINNTGVAIGGIGNVFDDSIFGSNSEIPGNIDDVTNSLDDGAKASENFYKAIRKLTTEADGKGDLFKLPTLKNDDRDLGGELWGTGSGKAKGVEANQIIITPTMDFSLLENGMGAFSERVVDISDEIANMIGSSVDNVIGSMANAMAGAIASGDNIIGALASTLLDGLGNLAISVGVITMGIGKTITALYAAMANPFGAIAGGAMLIALGVAMKAGAAAISNAGGSTASGGASSNYKGGYDYNNLGETEKRGAYTDQQSVTFKIEGNTLVGILEKQNTKRNRTI